MKKLFLLLLASILISSLFLNGVYADKIVTSLNQGLQVNTWNINTVKQYTNYTFLWDVSDAGGMLLKANLLNCSFVNFPDGKIGYLAAGVGTMTPDGNAWYFKLNGENLSFLGQYNFQIDCYKLSNSSISGNVLDSYEVTPSGIELTLPKIISLWSILIFTLLIFIGLLIAGIYLPSKNNTDQMTGYIIAVQNLKYLKYFCLIFDYLVGLLMVFLVWSISTYYLPEFDFIINLSYGLMIFLIAGTGVFFPVMIYLLIANYIRDSKLSDMLSRGLNVK